MKGSWTPTNPGHFALLILLAESIANSPGGSKRSVKPILLPVLGFTFGPDALEVPCRQAPSRISTSLVDTVERPAEKFGQF